MLQRSEELHGQPDHQSYVDLDLDLDGLLTCPPCNELALARAHPDAIHHDWSHGLALVRALFIIFSTTGLVFV